MRIRYRRQERGNTREYGRGLRGLFLGVVVVLLRESYSFWDDDRGDRHLLANFPMLLERSSPMDQAQGQGISLSVDSGATPSGLDVSQATLPDPTKTLNQELQAARNDTDDRLDLRFDWSNLPVQSSLAKLLRRSHTQCPTQLGAMQSVPRFWIHQPRRNGLGQMLHMWSQTLCNAMEADKMVLTRGYFNWMHKSCDPDGQKVANYSNAYSPFACYFGQHLEVSTQTCPWVALPQSKEDPLIANFTTEIAPQLCNGVLEQHNASVSDFRAASTEWLFSNVQDIVIEEARKQILQAFGKEGLPDREHLVTIHIRWGDKAKEMKLKPARFYVKEVHKLIGRKKTKNPDYPLHIYIATEDRNAIKAFQKVCPKHWKLHTSGPVTSKQRGPDIRKMANGRSGLASLGALLLAMEANYYVLTTKSNWSRLINELRKNVVDPRCNGCTKMADLVPGEW